MTLIIVLRLLHVVLGVFWAGTLIFFATYLVPSVREAGPDGAKVMAAIQRRRFLDVMPVVALLTIVSGIWLYWRMSGGSELWMRTATGTALGLGGLLAIVAFAVGVGIMRPATLKAGAMVRSLGDLPEGAGREAVMAEVGRLRLRGVKAGRAVAVLLFITAGLMAVARYL